MRKKMRIYLAVLVLFFTNALVVSAQHRQVHAVEVRHPLEKLEDAFVPGVRNARINLPGYRYFKHGATGTSTSIFTTQVNVDFNGQNITGDAANEPNIAINPLNKNEIVIGWRQFDNVTSNFRQAGCGYSADSGYTWTFPGVIEPGVFRSDPVLDYDAAGNFYYNSLTVDSFGNYPCKVFRSSNGGVLWDAGVDAAGGDKQWMAIDRTGGVGEGNIYSFWTSYYSSCQPGFFTRSTTGGNSYESCTEVDGDPHLGTMALNNDGDLFIAGAAFQDIVVSKSENARNAGSLIAWNFPQIAPVDGYLGYGLSVNPGGLLGQANIDVDRSGGPGSGNVYVLASVVRASVIDSGDVMFTRSLDGGLNWDVPVRVNDDPTTSAYQWFGTMSVAPDGRIDAVWLDTRDNPGSDLSALYYAYSTDQGSSWSANEKLSDTFDPHVGYPDQYKMGDYFDMVSFDDGAYLAWANTLNGEEDVYFSYIVPPVASTVGGVSASPQFSIYPNPANDLLRINAGKVPSQIEIFSVPGQKVLETTISKPTQEINISALPAGIYFIKWNYGGNNQGVKKLIRL